MFSCPRPLAFFPDRLSLACSMITPSPTGHRSSKVEQCTPDPSLYESILSSSRMNLQNTGLVCWMASKCSCCLVCCRWQRRIFKKYTRSREKCLRNWFPRAYLALFDNVSPKFVDQQQNRSMNVILLIQIPIPRFHWSAQRLDNLWFCEAKASGWSRC